MSCVLMGRNERPQCLGTRPQLKMLFVYTARPSSAAMTFALIKVSTPVSYSQMSAHSTNVMD